MSIASPTRTRLRGVGRSVRRPLFYLLCIVFLLFGFVAFGDVLPMVINAWSPEYVAVTHNVHHLMIGSGFSVLLLGVAVQLYRPAKRVGALGTSVILWAFVLLVFVVVGTFDPPIALLFVILLGIAALHPSRSALLPDRARLDGRMLVVAIVAAIPLVVLASFEVTNQLGAADDHAIFGHYSVMAAVLLTVATTSIYASFRPPGWRFPAFAAATLISIYGVGSVVFPGAEQGSSLGIPGVLAVLWALAYLGVAEYGVGDGNRRRNPDKPTESGQADAGMPP